MTEDRAPGKRNEISLADGQKALGRVVGNYLESGQFEEDFNELDAQKRLSLLEKLLKYIDSREEPGNREPEEASGVYFSILRFLESYGSSNE